MNHLHKYITIYKKIKTLSNEFNNKLNILSKQYISRSDINRIKRDYEACYLYIKNNFLFKILFSKFLIKYHNIEKIIEQNNLNFIQEEKQKYKNFFDYICGYPLDDNQ